MSRGSWRMDVPFERLAAEMREKLPGAVLKGAEYLHSEVSPLVPVDTSNLVGSGDVGMGAAPGDSVAHPDTTAHLYYPGPYALYQHEGVYFRRPGHVGRPLTHTHGESFFLERPFLAHQADIIRVIREGVGL